MNDHKCYECIMKKCISMESKNCSLIKRDDEYLYIEKDSDGMTINYDFIGENNSRTIGILEIIRLSEKKLYEPNIIKQRIYTYIAELEDCSTLTPRQITLNNAVSIFDKIISHFGLEKIIK